MGRKEWKRYDDREQVFKLIDESRPLTPDEIGFIKEKFSGIGGLTRSSWDGAQFFTPQKVVQFVHDLVGYHVDPGPVMELSCGGGAFFEGLSEEHCHGIEVCRRTFSVARALYPRATLYNAGAQEMFPYKDVSQLDGQFHYVIGNPPFGEKMEWGGDIVARKVKKLPSEVVFMELAYRAVMPGGKIALVVPEGLLNSNSNQYARKWLMDRCFVRAVISLPTETFYFGGTSCKTSVLYLQKFPAAATPSDIRDYKIFMAICEDIGWDSRGRMTKKDDLPTILGEWEKFNSSWRDTVSWGPPSEAELPPETDVAAVEAAVVPHDCEQEVEKKVTEKTCNDVSQGVQLSMF